MNLENISDEMHERVETSVFSWYNFIIILLFIF
jgi:hypothetical protein